MATYHGISKENLYLYCGAGIRPAVAEAIEAFETEAKTTVRVDYAGSGTLLSNIRASKRGDSLVRGRVDPLGHAGLEDQHCQHPISPGAGRWPHLFIGRI